ncbi:hypothetical protein MNEG_5685 [Monoraphidium neglectum]|uniref:Uncharacterized protein n=1 Tax=Monoraphidium neglectum TaxID=145388 RepID=A0A0D2N9B5_9CHLO|nr:hypothetical protein MNEG_5685 [Monoraphidium neglectum]KIZ02271.1 hypothetical protein MNEG_5685 [Monoraphidium neglectum]|eukprot:XP_013901290.1 hypothetical protein MNEG_5685 [Monoraphidium neglectum]
MGASPLAAGRSRRTLVRAADASGGAAPQEPAAPADPTAWLAPVCSFLSVASAAKAAAGALAPSYLLAQFFKPCCASAPELVALCGVVTAPAWLVAGWLRALQEAKVHNRLGSDTYKRLALGLLYAAVLALVVNLRFIAMLGAALVGWSFISLGATAYLSSRLYEAGSGGRSPLADRVEIVKSAFSNVASCLTLPKSLYGAYYSLVAVSSLGLFLWLFPVNATPLFPAGLAPLGQYLTQISAVGAVLQGITAFTLKDAADRGRLGASTFRLLNLALAATVAQQCWFFYSLGSSGVELARPLWQGILAQGLATVAVCDLAWLTAKK